MFGGGLGVELLNGLDLFSGIGGIAVGLGRWVKPIAYVEIESYCQAILRTRIRAGDLPAAPIWDDIRTFDGYPFRGLVDIIYGGFPCQDLSTAGLRKGLEAERSGLFFEIMRLAEEIRPQFLFFENVPGIKKYLGLVGRELAHHGYDARWDIVSAQEVGAPHIRKRWFCLAHAIGRRHGYSQKKIRARGHAPKFSGDAMADTLREGLETRGEVRGHEKKHPVAPYSSWWQSEPHVGRVVDELPFRVDRIRALGNAVVPAQVSEAFERLSGI